MISQYDIDVAAHVDLVLYCMSRGLELCREGREYVLKDYDSLYISAATPWKWYRFSTGEGGKAIDFCVKFLGMSFRDAVFELLSSAGCRLELPEREPERVAPSSAAPDARRVIAYLCKRRGIDYDIVKDLLESRKLYQDERGNCVFVIYDDDGNQIGGEIHGTGDARFKSQLARQDSHGFVLSDGDNCQVVCYFESAIDLLSFYQIFRDRIHDYVLVSMGGLKSSVIFSRQFSDCMCKSYLCVDNDVKGDVFAQQMQLRHLVPSVGKDWNEYLLYLRRSKG